MPPIRTLKLTPEEKRIAAAIRELNDGTLKNCGIAAKKHSVPYSKLYHRFQGRPASETRGGDNKALIPEQEAALGLYIDRCNELGRPCQRKHIEIAANSLLRASGLDSTVSKSWTTRYIKRAGIKKHRSKPLSMQRKAAQKQSDIELHFEKFRRAYQEYRVKPENLHNFDETGFRIGCLAGLVVFTRTDKQVYISDPDNRELMTSMESISAIGKTTDPMIIMAGQLMKEKHFPKGLNDGIRIAVSEL